MKNERASVTIEASLVLFTFLLGFLAINFMALNVLVETRTKLLLDNACLDLNNYIYLNDRLNIVDEEKVDAYVDKLLEKSSLELEGVDGRSLRNNPLFLRLKLKTLMGKYLNLPLEEFMENLGVKNLSFIRSKILEDNKNIEVVMEYDLDYQLFGLFDRKRHVVQVSHIVTHRSLKEEDKKEEEDSGMWHESNFTRGRYYVNKIREENKYKVCQLGQKIDLYDETEKTVTEIFSVNLFNKTYSSKEDDGYKLKKTYVKNFLENKALNLYDDVEKLGGSLKMDDGTKVKLHGGERRQIILVVPEEAKIFARDLDEIRREILKNNNTKIILRYRDKALK